MDELKQEVRDTVGLVLQHPEDAERYGIEWNGILLHGAPGVGKTYFAQAIAGEYGLNFIHVSTGDLISGHRRPVRAEHRQRIPDGDAEPAVPALLRRVRLRRPTPRQHARPGVAADRQPAPDLARAVPRRASAARNGGDELDRASRPGGDPARPLRPAHPHRPPGRGRAPRRDPRRAREPAGRRRDRGRRARAAHGGDDARCDREGDRLGRTRCLQAGSGDRSERRARHGAPRVGDRALRRPGSSDGRALDVGVARPSAGGEGAAPAAPGGDRGSRVRAPVRRRPADGPPPRWAPGTGKTTVAKCSRRRRGRRSTRCPAPT